MNQKAEVYNNEILAGILAKTSQSEYTFTYDQNYLNDPDTSAVSLTLPKTDEQHHSTKLFPFFFGLLAEGVNKQTQCKLLRIDENDHFTRLLKTADSDTIGSITVKEIES